MLGSWMTTYLGKSCSFDLPRVPFVNCRQFMYLVIFLLVLRAGCGIWLYQFLIIAYLFTLFQFVVYSEARTRLDNLTKIQSLNAWISSWNAQMLHFPLCRESVLGMPRTEIEFEFDMVFCFGIRLALYAVLLLLFFFHSDSSSTHCTTCWKWSSYKHRVCPSVLPFVRSQFMNVT